MNEAYDTTLSHIQWQLTTIEASLKLNQEDFETLDEEFKALGQWIGDTKLWGWFLSVIEHINLGHQSLVTFKGEWWWIEGL